MSGESAATLGTLTGLAPGSRVAGYLLETLVGVGGMAAVFRARDERLDRERGHDSAKRAAVHGQHHRHVSARPGCERQYYRPLAEQRRLQRRRQQQRLSHCGLL